MIKEQVARWLMLRDGLNDDWYYDCRGSVKYPDINETVTKYEKEAADLLSQLSAEVDKAMLTDEQIQKAWDDTFENGIYFDHQPTAEELIKLRMKAIAKTTIQAVIKLLEG